MLNKQRKHFVITLMASFAVHIFVLTAMFTLPESNEHEEYKMVRVKIGIKNQNTADAIVRARKYAAYSPGAGPTTQQEVNGNSTNNVPEVPATAMENLKQEKPEAQEPLQKKSKEVVSSEKALPEEPKNPQVAEIKKVVKQEAKADKPAPKPVMKRVEEHWSEEGVAIGNSADRDSTTLSSYEQMLPLWLDKFKKYPEEAKDEHLSGGGELFIKIDRKGKVLLAKVIKTTSYPILDRAIMNMIAAADPVLPVPPDYHPERKTFSYKIAVVFNEPAL